MNVEVGERLGEGAGARERDALGGRILDDGEAVTALEGVTPPCQRGGIAGALVGAVGARRAVCGAATGLPGAPVGTAAAVSASFLLV